MNDPLRKIVERGEVYRHCKTGGLYEVVGVALHTETNERLVAYQPLNNLEGKLYARPYDMFIENVELHGKVCSRFEKVVE